MNAHFNGRQRSRLARQRGFSMLEILITLFLLTLWLLASAGVQSASLQFNKAAQFRTQAVYFATDIAERMQANKTGATAGNYAYDGRGRQPAYGLHDGSLRADELAAFDLSEWSAGSRRRCRARPCPLRPTRSAIPSPTRSS
jgi:type IV pilus assembly protein PilV